MLHVAHTLRLGVAHTLRLGVAHTLRLGVVIQNLELKAGDDILDELRQGNGLDREARSLYTIVVRAMDSTQESYTSVSAGN